MNLGEAIDAMCEMVEGEGGRGAGGRSLFDTGRRQYSDSTFQKFTRQYILVVVEFLELTFGFYATSLPQLDSICCHRSSLVCLCVCLSVCWLCS